MKTPKYSFVVPVLNGESTLGRTLRSIQNQSFRSFEIIVADNGSVDRTAEIAQGFKAAYLFCKERGRARARNAGALKAKGQYLAFVDADVTLDRNWLEQVDRYLRRVPIDAVTTKIIPFKNDTRLLNRFRHLSCAWKTNGTFLNLCHPKGGVFPLINTAACVVSKESFNAVGRFDESLVRHEDLDLSLRLFAGGYLLGGTRRARVSVRFETSSQLPLVVTAAYLKRAFEVTRHSLWRPPRGPVFGHEFFRELLEYGGKRLFLLGVGVELASFSGRLVRRLRKENRSWKATPGPSNVRFSFSHGGRIFVLKRGVNLIFVDRNVFHMSGFTKSHSLGTSHQRALLGLLNNKRINVTEAERLLKLGIFASLTTGTALNHA